MEMSSTDLMYQGWGNLGMERETPPSQRRREGEMGEKLCEGRTGSGGQ